jgi:hypothetical protein
VRSAGGISKGFVVIACSLDEGFIRQALQVYREAVLPQPAVA